MKREPDELEGDIYAIFHPEPIVGGEGIEHYETAPLERLTKEFGLDTSYWGYWEFSTSSPLMHRTDEDDKELGSIIHAQQVPFELFMGTFRLFGDSMIIYNSKKTRKGPYRFYPAILMSGCAAFEAYVRIYSELLVKTVPSLPSPVQLALLEKHEYVDDDGKIRRASKYRSLLERYRLLLKFGFGVEYERGNKIWQLGMKAFDGRNELVHYKHSELPALKATELWSHLEALLLLFIGPSTLIRKTILPDVYELYGILNDLLPLIEEYEERPNFKNWPIESTGVMFPCPFINVDEMKYPDVTISRIKKK